MAKKLVLVLTGIVGVCLIVAFSVIAPYYSFVTKTLGISPIQTLLFPSSLHTVDNQVNILVLGIAGGTHDGPNLSDSITVAHYDFTTNTLSTLGVPRDLWSDTLKTKINAAYAIGEAKEKGGGLKLAKAEVGALLGLPIEYGVVIDFSSFQKLIDYLGGVDVVVPRTFTDYEYPITGKEDDLCGGDPQYKCRYETLHFEKGLTHMDGATALKFTRSRHAAGVEGSDFARSQRQQLVLDAVREKVMTVAKSKDVKAYTSLYTQINSLVLRDISNQDLAYMGKNIFLKKNFIQKHVTIPEDALYVPPYNEYEGQYVLVPTNKNFDNFHNLIECLIKNDSQDACSSFTTAT